MRASTLVSSLLFSACLVPALARPASAEPLGTTRVAVVEHDRLFADGGISVWVAARARLDVEKLTFKVSELPPDAQRAPRYVVPEGLPEADRKRYQKLFDDMDREAAEVSAWEAHEREVLDPIENEILVGLDRFARAKGIGLVIERESLGDGFLVVGPGADITDAFIKDYNTRAAAPSPRR